MSNLYRGENIGEITSSVKLKLVQNFETLAADNYTLYSPSSPNTEDTVESMDEYLKFVVGNKDNEIKKVSKFILAYYAKQVLLVNFGEKLDVRTILQIGYWPSLQYHILTYKLESRQPKLEPLLRKLMELQYFPKNRKQKKQEILIFSLRKLDTATKRF